VTSEPVTRAKLWNCGTSCKEASRNAVDPQRKPWCNILPFTIILHKTSLQQQKISKKKTEGATASTDTYIPNVVNRRQWNQDLNIKQIRYNNKYTYYYYCTENYNVYCNDYFDCVFFNSNELCFEFKRLKQKNDCHTNYLHLMIHDYLYHCSNYYYYYYYLIIIIIINIIINIIIIMHSTSLFFFLS